MGDNLVPNGLSRGCRVCFLLPVEISEVIVITLFFTPVAARYSSSNLGASDPARRRGTCLEVGSTTGSFIATGRAAVRRALRALR